MAKTRKMTVLTKRLILIGLIFIIISLVILFKDLTEIFNGVALSEPAPSETVLLMATTFGALGLVLMSLGLISWAYEVFTGKNTTLRHHIVAAILLIFGLKTLANGLKIAFPHAIGSKKISYSAMFKYTSEAPIPEYPFGGRLYFANSRGYPEKNDVNDLGRASGWSTTTRLHSTMQRAYACLPPTLIGYKDIQLEDGAEINETISLEPTREAKLIFDHPDDDVYDYNLPWDYDSLEVAVSIDGKQYPIESLCIIHLRVIEGKNAGGIQKEKELHFHASEGKIKLLEDKAWLFEVGLDKDEVKRAELLVMGYTTRESGYIGFTAKGELAFRKNK